MSEGLVQAVRVRGRAEPVIQARRNDTGGLDIRIEFKEARGLWLEFTLEETAPSEETMKNPRMREMCVLFNMLMQTSILAWDALRKQDHAEFKPAASMLVAMADMIGDILTTNPFAFAMSVEESHEQVRQLFARTCEAATPKQG